MFYPIHKYNNQTPSVHNPTNNSSYFKQGAIVPPRQRQRFIKKFAFTTEAQLIQTKLRSIPSDFQIKLQMSKFDSQSSLIKNIQEYTQNPTKGHWAYDEYLETDSANVKHKFNDVADLAKFPPLKDETELQVRCEKLLPHKQFILNDYKKRGLKDFIINELISDALSQKSKHLVYLIKTKYFDSDLSEEVRKIVQRVYDDFGIIIFPLNDKKETLKIYDSLQEAYKTAKSVGDKPPSIKFIDMTSMYKSKIPYAGFYDGFYRFVSINPMYLNNTSLTLKHEISGHALHHNNNRNYFETTIQHFKHKDVKKYLDERQIKSDFSNFELLFEKSKILKYSNELIAIMSDTLEFVAGLKENINFINFDTVENSFKNTKKILQACAAPRGFFADRVVLPHNFEPSQWKQFADKALKSLRFF
jgi:hypothetical protein